jgi:type II secretory pathway pseudopilin PulG
MKRENGFTLIELTITILFFIIVMAPLTTMLNTTISAGVDDRESFIAQSIARAMLEEIRVQAFEDPSALLGEPSFGTEEVASICNTLVFDDVDDYDIFQTWGGCSPPTRRNGDPISGAEDFTITVLVQNVLDLDDFASTGYVRDDFSAQPDATTNSKQVVVTVSWPRGTYQVTAVIMRINE